MPDIDTDIPDNRRQEVIDYVVRKYGRDHIANIITFGTLGAKQVIRDVGRVMNIPVRDTDMLAKMIPNTPRITLNEALQRSQRLTQIVGAEERYRKLFHYALRLEGLPRHASIHAAGIIMSSLSLEKVIPLTQLDEGMYTSQFTMEYLEERGLIKFDFLGLRNLSIIDEIVRKIQQNDPSFRLADIPLDDAKTYQLLSHVDTLGVFQLDSDGMKNLLRKIQPREFNDIVIVLALFRPASMKSIPLYLENRAHPENISYPSEELEPVLRETCGVMMYQEQAMLTARIAAGFSLARADVLRKAISKKKESELAGMRSDFIRGCVKNGYTEEKAEELFRLIDEFGGYGFNKSHAVAYALIAYQMAYLKSRYPMEFYTSLLDGVTGDDTKTMQYVTECRRRGIAVLYPDVNQSTEHYRAEGGAIRMPLTAVKSIGLRMTQDLISARSKQPFDDFIDFVARALTMKITRKMLENLIYAGALDAFGYNRTTMAAALDDAISYAELIRIEHNGVTTIDLGLVSRPAVVRRQDDRLQLAEME
ncbi:MAG: DNA polymerase III subunit alpha, partial [Solobacterium sp.]|nr:DNA polymerase III subunit alpha [Solobacterium sp.]